MSFEDDIEREIRRIPKHEGRTRMPLDISKHPLLRDVYDLMQMIEMFPASDHETATIIKAGEILDGVDTLRARNALLEKVAEWRSVYPTCEGYWWHRGPSGTGIRRVRMAPMFGSGGLGPYDADTNEPLANISGEWAGPIPVPAAIDAAKEGGSDESDMRPR
jgi:hypothetical protein